MTREEWLAAEIEKARRRISTFQAMIEEWELELGIARTRPDSGAQGHDAGGKKALSGDDPLAGMPGMIFFGKSQTEAAKLLLERVGYPLKTAIVLAGVEKGGVKVGGKTETVKKQNLYTILNRSPEFGRVARDTWGLIGWPGVSKKSADEPAENGKKADEQGE